MRAQLAVAFLLVAACAFSQNSEYQAVDGFDSLYRLTDRTYTYTDWQGFEITKKGAVAHPGIAWSTSNDVYVVIESWGETGGYDSLEKFWYAPVDMSEDWQYTQILNVSVGFWNWMNETDAIYMNGRTVTIHNALNAVSTSVLTLDAYTTSGIWTIGKLATSNETSGTAIVRYDMTSDPDIFHTVTWDGPDYTNGSLQTTGTIPWSSAGFPERTYSGYHDAFLPEGAGKWYMLTPAGLYDQADWWEITDDYTTMTKITRTGEIRYTGHPDFTPDGETVVYSDSNKSGKPWVSVADIPSRTILWYFELDFGGAGTFGSTKHCCMGPEGWIGWSSTNGIVIANYSDENPVDPYIIINVPSWSTSYYEALERPFMDDKYIYFHRNYAHPDDPTHVDLYRIQYRDGNDDPIVYDHSAPSAFYRARWNVKKNIDDRMTISPIQPMGTP